MRRARKLTILAGAASCLVLAAGCGSSGGGSSGPSDAQIADALGAKMVAGSYAIDGNPFCSIDKFLHNADEVSAANKSDKGHVIAAKDHSVGIVIQTPFAPSCVPKARDGLTKLSKKNPS